MPDVTAADAAIGGGSFAAVWAGFKWVAGFITGRQDKREADLNAREARLDAEEAAQVTALKERLDRLEKTQAAQGRELEAHRVAIGILVAKVAREDPAAPELRQVADILGAAFPIHLHTPTDMTDTLEQLKRGSK